MALLTSDDDPNSAPVTDLDLADGTSEPAPTDESPNPDLGPNSNMTPNPILDQNQDQVSGAQAISPSTSSNGPAPFDRPTQSSLNPSLFDLNSKPSSPTEALSILKFYQTPTPSLLTFPPSILSPTQNSPSVAFSIQHFDSLDT